MLHDNLLVKMFQIKLTLLILVAVLLTTATCAKQQSLIESRIVDGRTASYGQFPYYAFLEVGLKNDTGDICKAA